MTGKRWTYNRLIELLKNTGFSMVWTEQEFNDNKDHCKSNSHGIRILIKCACGCSILRTPSSIKRSIKRENYYCGDRGKNYCNNINGQTYNEDKTKKYCTCCKNMVLLNDFHNCNATSTKLSNICIPCFTKREKDFREGNITNRLEYNLKNCKKNTKDRNDKGRHHEFNIDLEYLLELWEKCNGICFRFKANMSILDGDLWLVSVDRIDPKKGYIKGNVQLVSWTYNLMKGDKTEEEMDKVFAQFKIAVNN